MKRITGKILSIGQRKKDAAPPPSAVVSDIDPLMKRIGRRPDGALEAVSEKIRYSTQEGAKRIYLIVSFMPVEGVLDGKPICIDRPIEFFLPTGQSQESMQWISATMRSLSLAARGGYTAQALADLRQVTWDKGPVRCGVNPYGKPMYHGSEVAAIAWSIQQLLFRRGFVDLDGNQIPARDIVARARNLPPPPPLRDEPPPLVVELTPEASAARKCPDCGGATVMLEGCECCPTCGWSRC